MGKIKTLRQCELFREFNFRELAFLASYMEIKSLPSQGYIFREGSPSKGLAIVSKGKIQLGSSKNLSAQCEFGPGDFFGELSLVEGEQTRAIEAKALEPSELLYFETFQYQNLVSKTPDLAFRLNKAILVVLREKLSKIKAPLQDFLSQGGSFRKNK